jgi:hypothetical protein
MVTAKQILEGAAGLIAQPHEWSRGGKDRYPETLCIMESLTEAQIALGATCTERILARDYICRVIGRYDSPVYWNDDPNRTHSEVLKALQDAAMLACQTEELIALNDAGGPDKERLKTFDEAIKLTK